MNDARREPLPIERFDYDLPPELIAQEAVEPRDSSRLLVVRRSSGAIEDRIFRELPDLLAPGDLLVVNDTRVLPARLFAERATGGRVELLLLARHDHQLWQAIAKPLRKIRPPEVLELLDHDDSPTGVRVRIEERLPDRVMVRFDDDSVINRFGQVPLPPYIREALADPERYQTVYARDGGSAAAPTAGLHFTPELLNRCSDAGIDVATVTLHVGLDTFQPIKVTDARDHVIHSEWFSLPEQTACRIRETRQRGSRVVAVGTTSVRTLESAAVESAGGTIRPTASQTRLYITPGYQFQLVDAMITNFHLPRTSLLLLVSAFAGEEVVRRAYAHAIERRYRFYSFGDACLFL